MIPLIARMIRGAVTLGVVGLSGCVIALLLGAPSAWIDIPIRSFFVLLFVGYIGLFMNIWRDF